MSALNAYNKLNANVSGLEKSSEKLSSGYRINRAGDDAAGLAISEKMRSQIRGLTQATRNAQDGISMIQTFEGAAQETHTILQRMKELATESANGTYDNATDRAAIQLEYDQLNDELNQIADTDYNGVIVLNGGVMSDGLEVGELTNGIGEFNYADKADQVAAKIAGLEADVKELKASAPADIYKDADIFNTVDENSYDLEAAKDLWEDLELTEADNYVDVTYTAKVAEDGTVSYEATKGVVTKTDGTTSALESLDTFEPTAVNENADGSATGKGGFTVGTGAVYGNVIFDASQIKDGDVITLRYYGPGESAKAPANAGFVDDTLTNTLAANPTITAGTDPSITINVKDDDMTAEAKNIFDALNGAGMSINVQAAAAGVVPNPGGVQFGALAEDGTITGGVTVAAAGGEVTLNGVSFYAKDNNDGTITIATIASGTGTTATKGTDLLTINTGKYTNSDTGNAKTLTVGLAFDSYVFPDAAGVDIAPIETADVSNPELDAQIADKNAQIAALKDNLGVSKSDAYDNSTAIMTYANNITLQVGARTKDAVNFTFNYNTDGTADMGTLEANLDISSRANGLNTANLSLATQDDANYAIDQIDKAINKVSMVRATFGSIQNRLEYKIENLTTTNENLTDAESTIRDTDMASEMLNYTKYSILQQAAQSMLAQANQQPQSILQLLG